MTNVKSREARLRRQAQKHGYRIEKTQGDYTLVRDDLNGVMYHLSEVGLDDIEAFFASA